MPKGIPLTPEEREHRKNTQHSRMYQRWKHLEYIYKITKEKYLELWEKQKGVCPICRLPLPAVWHRDTTLDHDHETGEVRGLLHRWCNALLGQARDNPTILRLAAEYLESFLSKVK